MPGRWPWFYGGQRHQRAGRRKRGKNKKNKKHKKHWKNASTPLDAVFSLGSRRPNRTAICWSDFDGPANLQHPGSVQNMVQSIQSISFGERRFRHDFFDVQIIFISIRGHLDASGYFSHTITSRSSRSRIPAS